MRRVIFLLSTLILLASCSSNKTKNVILLIGDGMGPQQLGLFFTYAEMAENSIYEGKETALHQVFKMGSTELSLTSPADAIVVDSACSATHLATGQLSGSEMLGLDRNGHVVQTVLEAAQEKGKRVGLVSDTRITHATPAAFASHQPHRSLENKIAEEMISKNIDVLLSGGIRHFLPQSVNNKEANYSRILEQTGGKINIKSKRKDELNLLDVAEDQGYQLAFNRGQLNAVDGKVLGLFSYSGMMDGIDYSHSDKEDESLEPSLAEMTAKALAVLENKEGFFLMVEGGQIDWAGHNNDAATMLHELIKFEEATKVVLDWAKNRKDTVVVMTADHETGGFGFSYSRYNTPKGKKLDAEMFQDREFKPNFNFIPRTVLDKIYAQKKSYANILLELREMYPEDMKAIWESQQRNAIAQDLSALMQKYNAFTFTLQDAKNVLATEKNKYYDPSHSYNKHQHFPLVHDFEAFYVYGEAIRTDLIGRALSEEQGVVWGTGTHTATPVTVTVIGDKEPAIKGVVHHSDVGEYLMDSVKN